jgi:cytochrome c553
LRTHTKDGNRRFASTLAKIGIIALFLVDTGCAVPGRGYLVAPIIRGVFEGGGVLGEGEFLVLRVRHRENPILFANQRRQLDANGRFEFEPSHLEVAGHELAKNYLVWLELVADGERELLWRTTFSRHEVSGPIDLECQLDRPVAHGQACRVRHGSQHPWLVAAGARTFAEDCASCHGADGRGRSAATAPPHVPDLTRLSARRNGVFDRDEIAEWIEGRSIPTAHGSRAMPIWGKRLSEESRRYSHPDEIVAIKLDSLMVYLESLQDDREGKGKR